MDLPSSIAELKLGKTIMTISHDSSLCNLHNCVKVVVDQNHVSGFLAHIRSIFTHCYSDIGSFQCHTIVDPITSHTHNVSSPLKSLVTGGEILANKFSVELIASDSYLP